ncbi:unnamed protein product [Bursaphelenchus xylophilus]|uniref:(pine wood nematode) hypothetical protein n=1 Tax=Bursaphelenchus xylophilus TaxID=6326 RepID=A0A1I7SMD1_BURXY|nr:unnamed protein product [Bursaphelenchus xylophilus]CAG9130124.1 unnamed protein product [Bursaphelenchus xylophilus]
MEGNCRAERERGLYRNTPGECEFRVRDLMSEDNLYKEEPQIQNGNGKNKTEDFESLQSPFITPAISRSRPSRIPQNIQPKKGILKNRDYINNKNYTDISPVSVTNSTEVGAIRTTLCYTLPERSPNSIRPTVGFSERNAVAIIGDTSDEYESDARNSLPLTVPSMPPIPETTLVLEPQKMVSIESDNPNYMNGFIMTERSNESTPERSQDDSKITEGRSTEDMASTTEDDQISISSSTCSSHIAGKWWNGKDTRYILHCEKKGCNHKHGDQPRPGEQYLTPTQRFKQEISLLKKQKKKLEEEIKLKDGELLEHRERFKQIDESIVLHHDSQLMTLLDKKEKKFEAEKERMYHDHIRVVEELESQIFELKQTLNQKNLVIEKTEAIINVPKQDVSTLTEPADVTDESQQVHQVDGQLGGQSTLTTPNDPNPNVNFLAVNATSAQTSPMGPPPPIAITEVPSGDPLTEAFRIEALFWREKAAQLEIIVKDQLIRNDLDTLQLVNDSLQTTVDQSNPGSAMTSESNIKGLVDDATEKRRKFTTQRTMTMARDPSNYSIPALIEAQECRNLNCIEQKKLLNEENEDLIQKMDTQFARNAELEAELSSLKELHEELGKQHSELKKSFEELAELAENRMAEIKSGQMAMERMQDEKEKLQQAFNYLEDKAVAYRNTILDNNLVVKGENTSEWHRGFTDPQFTLLHSIRVQTDLTTAELTFNENEFALISVQLREIQKEYSDRQIDLDAQFEEINKGLALKSQLVEKLSRQLEMAAAESQIFEKNRQDERDYYKKKLETIGREVEKLPGLQMELERAQQEKSILEIQLKGIREQYEDGLESALEVSLQKSQQQEKYWQEKLISVERAKNRIKNNLEQSMLDYDNLKIKSQVEKTDLEQRLASSIQHIAFLNAKLNPPVRDAQCEAKPRTVNKYVACRPNQRHKNVEVDKRELQLSKSDEDIQKLFKYKEAFTKTRIELSKIQENQIKSNIIKSKPVEVKQPDQTHPLIIPPQQRPQSYAVKKSGTVLSLDQVLFDKDKGVQLPELRREQSLNEISTVSSPMILIRDDSASTSYSQHEGSKETAVQTVAENHEDIQYGGIQDDKSSMTDLMDEISLCSLEEIKNMEKQTRQLQDEVLLLRAKAAESDTWMEKISRIQFMLPQAVMLVDDEDTPAFGYTAIGQILDSAIEFLDQKTRQSRSPLKRQSSEPDLKLSVHSLEASTDTKFKPLPIPDKWDNERQELLRQNAHYAAQLLALQAKLSRLQGEETKEPEQKTQLDELEGDLKELARQLTTVPIYNAEQLAKARKERDTLRIEIIDLRTKLRDALNELQIFRIEPTADAQKHWDDVRLGRGRSAERLDDGLAGAELRRWKESAGVSFREVNRLRLYLNKLEEETLNMRTQTAILRGEMELAKCQTELANQWAVRRRIELKIEPGRRRSMSSLYLKTVKDHKNSMNTRRSMDRLNKAADNTTNELQIVQQAFRKQVNGLKQKNNDLEEKVKLLNDKIETNKKEMIKITEHEEVVGKLNSQVVLLQNENNMYEMKIRDIEDERQQMYLLMFRKGQQAAHHEISEEKALDEMTEDKMLLKFLHDAFYYYLLNRGDSREHLQAIMTMLNFTSKQKDEVYRRRGKSQ